MTKLPRHTVKYWAEQAYQSWLYNGNNQPRRNTTVQGVAIIVTPHPVEGFVLVHEVASGEEHKVKVQRNWSAY